MALFVVHDCAKVGVGVPNVDSGRIAAVDVDRWGSGGVAVLAEKCVGANYDWQRSRLSLKNNSARRPVALLPQAIVCLAREKAGR